MLNISAKLSVTILFLLSLLTLLSTFVLLDPRSANTRQAVQASSVLTTFNLSLMLDDPSNFRSAFGQNVIFMLETSKTGVLKLRQVCALEAAASLNPHINFILAFSDLLEIKAKDNPALQELLQHSPNVKLATLDSSMAVRGTPVQDPKENKLKKDNYYIKEHTSNFLRMSLLWKLGGMYMDLDYMTLKNLSAIIELKNFLTADADYNINNSLLGFERHNPFLFKILETVRSDYDPKDHPTVVRSFNKAVMNVFKISIVEAIRLVNINNQLHVLNYFITSPIKYSECHEVYRTSNASVWFEYIREHGSYTIHLWNSCSRKEGKLDPKSNDSPYVIWARGYCPRAIARAVDWF
ncbi:alpha-1,4-N-acetylglucosaminyltransferase-like [Neocloeon triangulifer]|uniref:alpha-1,4-N-acetylglucosaminyltransferase-like n=1 Tax=Neocloeon triangulifer TaxID=2078957 RepID=UPI00286F3F71|nr:alpha-1,4-N-acetylglucosaminyltransferase-like [Neocloeon triangulifer]